MTERDNLIKWSYAQIILMNTDWYFHSIYIWIFLSLLWNFDKLYKKPKLLSNGLILRNYKNTLFHWKNQLQKIQYIIEDTKVIFPERNLNEFVLPNSNNRLTIMNAIRRILHILNPFNIMKLHFDKCAIDLLNFFSSTK